MSRELVTTLLDLTGLLLAAVGLGLLAAGALLGAVVLATGLGAVVTGAVLLCGSRVIDWCGSPDRAPVWWPRGERR